MGRSKHKETRGPIVTVNSSNGGPRKPLCTQNWKKMYKPILPLKHKNATSQLCIWRMKIYWSFSIPKICIVSQTSKDVDTDMVCGRPSSCYGLRGALKFQATPSAVGATAAGAPSAGCSKISVEVFDVLWYWLCPFHRKISNPLTRTLGNVYANFDFSTFLFTS